MKGKSFLELHKANQAGFSLVELMIVVAIITILSALAVPRFQNFQAKARQSEAKNNLSHIYTLQQSYFGDNDEYGNVASMGNATGTSAVGSTSCNLANDIGFRLTDCNKVRYNYAAVGTRSRFTATAVSGAAATNKVKPNCPAETWTIDENKALTVTNSVLTAVCD